MNADVAGIVSLFKVGRPGKSRDNPVGRNRYPPMIDANIATAGGQARKKANTTSGQVYRTIYPNILEPPRAKYSKATPLRYTKNYELSPILPATNPTCDKLQGTDLKKTYSPKTGFRNTRDLNRVVFLIRLALADYIEFPAEGPRHV